MAKKIKRNFLRILWNSQGQMAIFMILIFQVLFMFFAMVINVSLVIHDKINLQNSVDLAAYYGAQKQAEVLNAIAHSNYQIRQGFKLLTFRSRVLGTTGVDDAGSRSPLRSGDMTEAPWSDVPAICITSRPFWVEGPDNQNLCKKTFNTIPPLPRVNVVFPGAINIGAIASANRALIAAYNAACSDHGGRNWMFAMRALTSFRYDQANRKKIIWALGNNLMQKDFVELSGSPVSLGVKKTLFKNLTFQNRGSGDDPAGGSSEQVQWDFINSMSKEVTGLNDAKEWLVPIRIDPTLLYSDVESGDGCNAYPKSPLITGSSATGLPERGPSAFNFLGGNGQLQEELNLLKQFAQFAPVENSDLKMSLGVEKNPWYMVYFGVQAKTAPRQIFFPFGPRLQLTARGFAKPFGGRIGPWYGQNWPSGATESSGPETDPLAPVRLSELMGSTCTDDSDGCRRISNYSRFPGDTMGMRSKLSYNATSLTTSSGQLKAIGNFNFYNNIVKEFTDDSAANDVLAWNSQNPADPKANDLRNQEIAAIQPDLFDAVYYSIQPQYGDLILPLLKANKLALGIPSNVAIRGDLGSRGDSEDLRGFNVANQIEKGRANLRTDLVFYALKNKAHLLTGWVSKAVADYTFPDNAYGKCGDESNPTAYFDTGREPKIIGGCISGGRVGYSVKIVSRDMLLSSVEIGGEGLAGPIANPPPTQFGW